MIQHIKIIFFSFCFKHGEWKTVDFPIFFYGKFGQNHTLKILIIPKIAKKTCNPCEF
jgi:hypothetical protein